MQALTHKHTIHVHTCLYSHSALHVNLFCEHHTYACAHAKQAAAKDMGKPSVDAEVVEAVWKKLLPGVIASLVFSLEASAEFLAAP